MPLSQQPRYVIPVSFHLNMLFTVRYGNVTILLYACTAQVAGLRHYRCTQRIAFGAGREGGLMVGEQSWADDATSRMVIQERN